MQTHILKPIGMGSDILNPIVLTNLENKSVSIGRGNIVSDFQVENIQYISRKHLEIISRDGYFYLKSTSKQAGIVYHNNIAVVAPQEPQLYEGDKITLLGKLNLFTYELCVSNTIVADNSKNSTEEVPPNHHVSSFSSSSIHHSHQTHIEASHPEAIPAEMVAPQSGSSSSVPVPVVIATAPANTRELEENAECAICLSTIALAHTLFPCGDTFCYQCILDWSCKHNKCPNCQVEFRSDSLLHNRCMDNMIRGILEISGNGKLEEWEVRCGQAKAMKASRVAASAAAASSSSSSAGVVVVAASGRGRAGSAIRVSNTTAHAPPPHEVINRAVSVIRAAVPSRKRSRARADVAPPGRRDIVLVDIPTVVGASRPSTTTTGATAGAGAVRTGIAPVIDLT